MPTSSGTSAGESNAANIAVIQVPLYQLIISLIRFTRPHMYDISLPLGYQHNQLGEATGFYILFYSFSLHLNFITVFGHGSISAARLFYIFLFLVILVCLLYFFIGIKTPQVTTTKRDEKRKVGIIFYHYDYGTHRTGQKRRPPRTEVFRRRLSRLKPRGTASATSKAAVYEDGGG